MAHKVRNGGLEALRDDPFVDLIVRSNGKEWKVHKTYFAGESQALVATINNRMREGTENSVSFDDHKPLTIECFLHYQYAGFYDELKVVKDHLTEVSSVGQPAVPPIFSIKYVQPHPQWKLLPLSNTTFEGFRLLGNPLTKRELTAVLHVNIELYKLADMYFLPELQRMARTKLLGAEKYFVKSDFDEVLDFLWESTAQDDIQLRLAVYRRCTINHEIIRTFPKFENKLQELVGFVAWETMKMDMADKEKEKQQERLTVSTQANERIKTLEFKVVELKQELADKEREQQQDRSAAYTHDHAKMANLKSKVSMLKQNLSGVNKALKTSKKTNSDFANENRQLKRALDEINFEWGRWAVPYCNGCRQRVPGTQWNDECDENGRYFWDCVECGCRGFSALQ